MSFDPAALPLRDQSVTAIRPNPQHIPTLDGWRAIAILLVLASHTGIALHKTLCIRYADGIGQHGVAIFFVLRGFLITSRLQRENQTRGSIDLRSFYVRRFFRLMPCAWTYLAAMFVMTSAVHPRPFTMQEIWASLFCFRNYVDTGGIHATATGHFWSLSIEEQFYLLWPSLLILGRGRWARWLAAAGAVGIALYRFEHWTSLSHLPLQASFGTQYRADALLAGCATALFLPVLRPYLRAWMSLPLLAALIWCATVFDRIIPLRESIVIALLLALTSERLHPWFSSVLDWKPLAFVGTLSYSLYIWQHVFLVSAQSLPALLMKILILPFVALSSYYLIEKPLIRMGKKLTQTFQISSAAPDPHPTSQADPAPCIG